MNFDIALKLLRAGHTVRMKYWLNGEYLAISDGVVRWFDHGIEQPWPTWNVDILSNQWEVIEPFSFYDQGFKDGHEAGWDEALERYLKALEHYDVPSLENSRAIITTLQERKDA